MRFGDIPTWAKELSTCIRELVEYSDYDPESMNTNTCEIEEQERIFPSELLHREPLFNALIANSYQPGEGICAHVDLMRFEDGIALVSLESSCVMHFSRVENEFATNEKQTEANIPVYLTPGSLLLISGEARYQWKHEINRKPGFQTWDGVEIDQKRRTSITLRKLCNNVTANRMANGETVNVEMLSASNIDDGADWVDLFVREILSASNIDDARTRVLRALELLEKSICERV